MEPSEHEADAVQVTTQFSGDSDEIKEYLERRIKEVQMKLDKNPNLRTLFITDSLQFLATEGLLADAKEVKFEIKQGSFSDLAMMQSVMKQNPELIFRPAKIGIVIRVCITVVIVIRGATIQITICASRRY